MKSRVGTPTSFPSECDESENHNYYILYAYDADTMRNARLDSTRNLD